MGPGTPFPGDTPAPAPAPWEAPGPADASAPGFGRAPVPASGPMPDAGHPALGALASRRSRRNKAKEPWGAWALFFAATGIVAGITWWLAAPGGAFYGSGTDYQTWLPRDLTLGLLLLAAGVATGVLALRGWKMPRGGAGLSLPMYLCMVLGCLAASVLAWRIGVFAGDLFQTPPDNMANPSIVFSLRSPTVLLLWPLASSLLVVWAQLISIYMGDKPASETREGAEPLPG
ncbi:hypothetical protein CVV67_07935 [Arthrobacter stackebrandtii]|nr:hypothetical protein CVV67_07935 [Arthrobacter stackebrandtii]